MQQKTSSSNVETVAVVSVMNDVVGMSWQNEESESDDDGDDEEMPDAAAELAGSVRDSAGSLADSGDDDDDEDAEETESVSYSTGWRRTNRTI